MAKLYGQLPSYVRANATTYDMLVTNTMQSWEKEQYDKAIGKLSAPQLSTEEMVSMLDRVRNKPTEE
jgi:hypothetical protein